MYVKKGGFMHSSQNHKLNSGDTSVINFFILFLLNKRLKSIEIKWNSDGKNLHLLHQGQSNHSKNDKVGLIWKSF